MLRTEVIRPVHELLDAHAAARPGDVAFADDVRAVTWSELATTTRRLAGHLAALDVGPGDRVAMVMGNAVEVAETYLAVPRAGAVAVCLNPDAAPAELEYMLADSGARVVVTDEAHAGLVEGTGASVVLAGGSRPGWSSYADLIATEPPVAAPDPADLDVTAFMLYTSGTTGRPKGVELSLRSCLWVVAACWAPIVGLGSDDVVLSALPLFHSYALDLCVLGVVATGAGERILPRFSPTRILEMLGGEQRYTVLPGVPTGFSYLLQAAGDRPPAHRLRLAISAGAILPAAVDEAFEQAFGVQLLDGYGITETSTMVTMNWPHGARPYGSCGLPLPGLAVRLVDPATGTDAPPGGEGELWVRGPNVMRGYWGRPEQTASVLVDGWYRTGDLARADAHGYLTISGRTKEMIIRGGENIYPAEIENVLLTANGVADAAVVGRAHPDLGEEPVAFVVGDADLDALAAHCRERLTWFKVPADFRVVDVIPRTGSGKIKRFELVRQLDEVTA
ncbi:acyl-CoA synthetase (AMP-forming)/AMP-acid ligase II [Actinomycetospora succinea]|uniref:Acyl-CoA synthetase (AMP-forming)/AMP-acid ligase II n=1 Tax=Actinomycetospora succinea TaxID=663603 RepID=A0A4R6VSK2_9PSEU|nr:AMP-binding protein [Actinomycetospora succinea]TDQ65460.1 acyl-CoA synthetase (AMP-forming)/AMP-acid ligase II [Actinomycetospora succinea]